MSGLSFKNFFRRAQTLPNCFFESFFWPSYGDGTERVFLLQCAAIQHLWITCKWYANKSYTRVSLNRVVLTIIQLRVYEIARLWPWPTNIKKSHTRNLFPNLKTSVPQNRTREKWLRTEQSSCTKFRVCDFKGACHHTCKLIVNCSTGVIQRKLGPTTYS